jgi:hypothetical protein
MSDPDEDILAESALALYEAARSTPLARGHALRRKAARDAQRSREGALTHHAFVPPILRM